MNKTQIRSAKKVDLLEHLGIDDPNNDWKRDELIQLALDEREAAEKNLINDPEDGGEPEPEMKDTPDDVDPAESEDLETDPAIVVERDEPKTEHGHYLNDYAIRVWNGQGSMPVSERCRRVIRALKNQGFSPDEIREHLKLPVGKDVNIARYVSEV